MADIKNNKENLVFQAEVSKLLDLMANSLYSEREIFLRELISNSADACEKLRYEALSKKGLLGKEKELQINIRVSKKKKIIEIEDNGIGVDNSLNNKSSHQHQSKGINITSNRIDVLRKITKKNFKIIGPFQLNNENNEAIVTKVEIILDYNT